MDSEIGKAAMLANDAIGTEGLSPLNDSREQQVKAMTDALAADPAILEEVAKRLPPYSIAQHVNVSSFLPFLPVAPPIREEFQALSVGGYGLQRLLDDYQFDTVLDVGAGLGHHADIMLRYGKDVTELDLGRTVNFSQERASQRKVIVADINQSKPTDQFDCVWASHILEHQPNVQHFLTNLKGWSKPGGILAITVPPLKNEVVSGHVNLFTPGHVLYNLAVAGIDCSRATTLAYHYNITVIVENNQFDVPDLTYDAGDIGNLLPWLPPGFVEGIDGFSQVFVQR